MGPLQGVRIVEMAGIGPAPFACMLLADLGAEVIRIDRPSGGSGMGENPADILGRNRRSIAINLKSEEGIAVALELISTADILIEGYRPGVMEKLGLSPEVCLEKNPKLIFGRMTGWGQTGPLAQSAGHDINYLAITGALDAIGNFGAKPTIPLNLVGDFGGGSLYLVMGVLAALIDAKRSGIGQVVDASITDGVISLMTAIHGLKALGIWDSPRGGNVLDGGAHYYDTYQCSDEKFITVGAIEPQFYDLLMTKLDIDLGVSGYEAQFNKQAWPEYKKRLAEVFLTKTQSEWCELLEGTDACFAPVLSMDEAPNYPQNKQRESFIEIEGVMQTAPAPKFSRTKGEVLRGPIAAGTNTETILKEIGFVQEKISQLIASGVVMSVENTTN